MNEQMNEQMQTYHIPYKPLGRVSDGNSGAAAN